MSGSQMPHMVDLENDVGQLPAVRTPASAWGSPLAEEEDPRKAKVWAYGGPAEDSPGPCFEPVKRSLITQQMYHKDGAYVFASCPCCGDRRLYPNGVTS